MSGRSNKILERMLIEIFEERQNSLVKVGDLIFEGEESFSNGLKSIWLYNWPFFYDFNIMFLRKEKSYFV